LSSKVVKENQVLHKGDRIIDNDDESATLADANIFAGDQIIVRDSEIHENRDIAGKLFDSAIMVMQSLYFYSHREYEV
jgi:ubiquitin carboxyl-terminal hydrolase 48